MPQIKAKDGATISFSDQGSGYPVIFLHGWLMSQKVWHFQLPLTAEFRIITLDLRGHGESAASGFSYADCLSDMTELLDYLQIQTAVVVGWSMGAQLALKAALLLKERLSGLLLVAGTPRFCSSTGYSYGLPPSEARGMAIRLKRDYQGAAGGFFKGMFTAAETASIELKNIAAKTVGQLPPQEIALAALQALTDTDLRRQLAEIFLPAMLVHGAEDNICLPGASLYMSQQLPLATLEIIGSSGHAPFLSAPERFNATVTGFIRTIHGRD